VSQHGKSEIGVAVRYSQAVIDDSASQRAIYQALKAVDEVARCVAPLGRGHHANPERALPETRRPSALKLLHSSPDASRQGSERLMPTPSTVLTASRCVTVIPRQPFESVPCADRLFWLFKPDQLIGARQARGDRHVHALHPAVAGESWCSRNGRLRATSHDRCRLDERCIIRDTFDSSAFDQQLRAFVVAERRVATCTDSSRLTEAWIPSGGWIPRGGLGYGIASGNQETLHRSRTEVKLE